MWGWSYITSFWYFNFAVFPMYVGVILKIQKSKLISLRVPHVCGGDPKAEHASTEQ